tara:strand:- start:4844 stop:5452 length:609 start_codon:yes stop_codon:yes gene_type:complete
MWIMTNKGFYSIVRKPWDREARTLTVRARRLDDLNNFLEAADRLSEHIEKDTSADYTYRVQIEESVVGITVLKMLTGITYDNFKNSVSDAGRLDHARAYANVWHEMRSIQEKPKLELDMPTAARKTLQSSWDAASEWFEEGLPSDCAECGGDGEVHVRNGIDPPEWVECRTCNVPPSAEDDGGLQTPPPLEKKEKRNAGFSG